MSVVPVTFRSRVRAGVEPIARLFGRVGLTPNALTLIGLAIAVVGAWFASNQAWLIAGLVVAFGAIFDLFDGALARATNRVTKFGAFLDSTTDRIGEAVVYLGIGIGLYWWGTAWLAAAAMAAGFMVSYVRARAEGLGFAPGNGFASVGLAPREVRVAILVLGLLATELNFAAPFRFPIPSTAFQLPGGISGSFGFSFTGLRDPFPVEAALALITILATITAIQRILFTYNQSRSQTQEVSK